MFRAEILLFDAHEIHCGNVQKFEHGDAEDQEAEKFQKLDHCSKCQNLSILLAKMILDVFDVVVELDKQSNVTDYQIDNQANRQKSLNPMKLI